MRQVILLVALSFIVMQARAQEQAQEQPLSLRGSGPGESLADEAGGQDYTRGEAGETTSSGGFWMWPDPAPLTGRIATDRPGFSDSAGLVPRGRHQFEMGYTYTYDRENDRRVIDHQFPELAYRTGLTDYLEFRVNWTGASLTEVLDRITTPAGRHIGKEDHDDGWRDLTLGVKLPIIRDRDQWPNVSVIYTASVPTGNSTKSTGDVNHEIKLPWNYALNDKWTLYGSVLGRYVNSPNGHHFQSAATLAAGYHLSEDVTLYTEYFGIYPGQKEQDCAHILSVGPIVHLADNVSLDLRAGLGLNEQAPDFQASVGLGFRF